MTISEVKELYAFDAWATNRILETVSLLSVEQFKKDLGSSFGGVYGTLVHIVASDWIWLDRWTGQQIPRRLTEAELPDLSAVKRGAASFQESTRAYLDGLTDADVERWYAYADIKGNRYEDIYRYGFVHKVNHASYHRGQITTFLRQLGGKTIGTDLIAWRREMLKREKA